MFSQRIRTKMLYIKLSIKIAIQFMRSNRYLLDQTSRKLSTRIVEHRNNINWNTNSQSVITDHRLEYNHELGERQNT